MGHSRPLFIFVFLIELTVKCSISIFSDDWIRTADLWLPTEPQLSTAHLAQWIPLCLPSCGLGFISQAHTLSIYSQILWYKNEQKWVRPFFFFFFLSHTPTLTAFTGVTNAHGPSPQPTAFRSPSSSLTTARGSNQAKAKFKPTPPEKSGVDGGANQLSTYLGQPLHLYSPMSFINKLP